MKFILTFELGRLARWLRIMGLDTVYYKNDKLGSLIIQALREDRVIITRKKDKIDDLEKKTVVLSAEKVQEQLKEVIAKLNLKIDENKMFTRCALCNEILTEANKEDIKKHIPTHVYETQDDFWQCALCKRVYWRGSHWGNIKETIVKLSNC